MAVKVMIGHAQSDENGRSTNGKAGDQSGRELYIREWYNRSAGWDYVIRARSAKDAETIAKTMEDACNNDHIGYDQNQRTTLYTEAKKVGFDLTKIDKDCETDCSALVAVCVNAAGIQVSKDMYTGNEAELLKRTEMFSLLIGSKYTTKPDNLKRGDILLGKGHTAVVLSNGINNATKTETTVKNESDAFTPYLVRMARDEVIIRSGPGTKYTKVGLITDKAKYTIVERAGKNNKWGRLKSGAGWIYLDYTTKV